MVLGRQPVRKKSTNELFGSEGKKGQTYWLGVKNMRLSGKTLVPVLHFESVIMLIWLRPHPRCLQKTLVCPVLSVLLKLHTDCV